MCLPSAPRVAYPAPFTLRSDLHRVSGGVPQKGPRMQFNVQPRTTSLVFFPGRARSALLPYQDFFILFYFFEEGFGRHFANHRYEFLAFFFSSFHRPWETRTRLNWSNTEGKGSMQHGGRKKSSVPCACGASLQCTLPMTWCNFKRIFFEMLRTVASPETFVFRKIRK